MPSSGNPTWVDGSGGGTPIAAVNLNNIETAVTGSVAKSGDTMTGNLTLNSTSGVRKYIINTPAATRAELVFQTGGVDRIKIVKNVEAESGGNTGSHLEIISCSDAGAELATLFKIWRTGVADAPFGINAGGPPTSANNVQVPNTQWVRSSWATALALPLTATYYYRTGGNTSSTLMTNGAALGAMVFVAGRTCTLSRIAVNVTVAGSAGAVIRLALVQVTNPDTRAWTLVSDLGTVAATTTGVKELTGSMSLTQGVMYAALAISQGAAATQPTLTYCIPPGSGSGFGCSTNTSAFINAVPTFAVSGITGAVGASGTGAESSLAWACVVRADT